MSIASDFAETFREALELRIRALLGDPHARASPATYPPAALLWLDPCPACGAGAMDDHKRYCPAFPLQQVEIERRQKS